MSQPPAITYQPKSVDVGAIYADAGVITDPGAQSLTGTVQYDDEANPETLSIVNVNGMNLFALEHVFSTAGAHPVTISVTDDGGGTGTEMGDVTVLQSLTTTTVTASDATPVYGETVTLTANVAAAPPGGGTPTGTVTFVDGNTDLGSATLDSWGHASIQVSTLALGFHEITMAFGGDPNFIGSTSDQFGVTVAVAATTTTISASDSSVVYGQPATFTATVAENSGALVPTGTVTFLDGKTVLGTQTLDGNGAAALEVSTLPPGTPIVTASYGGDSIFPASATSGPDSLITSVAGTAGECCGNGDGGPATAAQVSYPGGVAVDSAGDLFIADSGGNRVRVIGATTGVITTLAGNGTLGYSGDGGPATAAELKYPGAIAVDAAGDVFIADSGNNAVREVVHATGNIITVAGDGTFGYGGDNGPATAAELAQPSGVALDGRGNLFIADYSNSRIREVSLSTGVITTFAGNGIWGYSGDNGQANAAELRCPWGIAVDTSGDVFISDFMNCVVREVKNATGVITTVAGSGAWGNSGENGPATNATFNMPVGVSVDTSGNLFICDYGNEQISEVNASNGVITLIAGNGIWGYSGDGGPAAAASLCCPCGVAVDSADNVYIADYENNRIREVAAGGGVAITVIVAPQEPTNVAATPVGSGEIDLSWSGDGTATSYTVQRGTPVGAAVASYQFAVVDDGQSSGQTVITITTPQGAAPGGYLELSFTLSDNSVWESAPINNDLTNVDSAFAFSPFGISPFGSETSCNGSNVTTITLSGAIQSASMDDSQINYGVAYSWTTVATPSVCSFSDTGLSPSTAYQYQISASNAAGTSGTAIATASTTSG